MTSTSPCAHHSISAAHAESHYFGIKDKSEGIFDASNISSENDHQIILKATRKIQTKATRNKINDINASTNGVKEDFDEKVFIESTFILAEQQLV